MPLTAVIVAALLALAGCGDDDDGDVGALGGATTEEQTTTEPTATAPGTTTEESVDPQELFEDRVNFRGAEAVSGEGPVEMGLRDFFFEPTVLRGDPGATVSVELRNEGDVPHTFTLDGQDIDEVLDPGATRTVEITLPDSDTTQFICRFHESQGMIGALDVAGG